jgi:hypothetical protein
MAANIQSQTIHYGNDKRRAPSEWIASSELDEARERKLIDGW